jgi:hypothetical protein
MTDLLDSVYNQYPIGSLLVWETDESIATLDSLGPFAFPEISTAPVGYLLDGHQRLSTLAGALVPRDERKLVKQDQDPVRWDLIWNMEQGRFQHGRPEADPSTLFPLTSLLDTLRFFNAVERVRATLSDRQDLADQYVSQVSQVSRAFQHYRVPVIRIRQTGLSEAVEIFARLNSKGQAMSADQMVSALTYQQQGSRTGFDLAGEISELSAQLGEQNFGNVDRTTILRAILASIDEDIYKTDWTRLASTKREGMLPILREGVERTAVSLDRAITFLKELGVTTGRLLPYTMQLALISAYFDSQPNPSATQLEFLGRWFWVSSFSGWFGGANPSRVNSLISEFRNSVASSVPDRLENFDMNAMSLPFPSTFDMRSARTRTLLLIMLRLQPRYSDGAIIVDPWRTIAEKGPDGVGYVFGELPRDLVGSPANRMIRPPGAERGQLRTWIERELVGVDEDVLHSHGLNEVAMNSLLNGDVRAFVLARQSYLIEREQDFQKRIGIRGSDASVGGSPVDTD